MAKFSAKIIDPVGLHARPSSIVVAVAAKFESKTTISSEDKSGNLKSIMNVMALAIKQNDIIEIEAIGSDEDAAIKAIEKTMKENSLI